MNVVVQIGSIFPKDVGDSIYEQLLQIAPEGQRERCLLWRLNQNDSRVAAIEDLLVRSGFRPWERLGLKKPQYYRIEYRREYSDVDLDRCQLLVPDPTNPIGEVAGRNEHGLLKLHGRGLGGHSDIGFTLGAIIVTDRLKLAMEQAGLKRLLFKETAMSGRTARPPIWPFWELTSDLVLPPLSPTCTIMDNDGEPFDGDLNKGCFLVEGLYNNPEYHYRASDLRAVEPFDLALTRELFGNAPGAVWPGMICSKRFYEFCREHNLPMNWQPVRIDPD